jgi:histidinol-phosphate aminotransferase
MALVKKNILKVTPYAAGKPIEETRRELGLKHVIKLASNENPLGPSPRALAAMRACLSGVNRYPDSQGYYLRKALAQYHSVACGQVLLGNGSDEIIDILFKTFFEPGDNVVTSETTFLEYAIIASVYGAEVRTAPLRNFTYDLNALAKKIDSRTKLVFIANPNNPTGTYVARKELERCLGRIPARVAVVLDEAYDAFIDVKDYPASLRYIAGRNVILLKTFSKVYGLAGVRVGYALAREQLIGYMERCRQPFNVNLVAQAGACAALKDREFLRKTRSVVLAGRSFFYSLFERMGIAYVPSQANFVLFDAGRDGVTVFKKLLSHGVIVRDMQQYGLRTFLRVTVGTKRENEMFARALEKVLS